MNDRNSSDYVLQLDWLAFLFCPIDGCRSKLTPGNNSVSNDQRYVQVTSEISTNTEIVDDVEASCQCKAIRVHSVRKITEMLYNDTAENIAEAILDSQHLDVVIDEELVLKKIATQIGEIESKQPKSMKPMIVNAVVNTSPDGIWVVTNNGLELMNIGSFSANFLLSEGNQAALNIPLQRGDERYFVLEFSGISETWTLKDHWGDRDFVNKMSELEKQAETDVTIDRARNVLRYYFPNARKLSAEEVAKLNSY